MIYLDYASHTPVSESVLHAFCRAEREFIGNPSSSHGLGRRASEELNRVTRGIADLIHVDPSEIIYTSGASEANNLAIKGIARAYAHSGRHILSTCLEHPSVSGALAYLQESGYEIELLKIRSDGTIDLDHLERALRSDTILLAVSTADSELGALQPIGDIGVILKKYPTCHLHVDAAQSMGKIAMPQEWMQVISTLCFSPHKFYGLLGSGVLVKRDGVVLEPLIHGGAGASLYRGGTQTLALAVACHEALNSAICNQEAWLDKVGLLREYVLQGLGRYTGEAKDFLEEANSLRLDSASSRKSFASPVCSSVKINSPAYGSPYILNISVAGITGADFQRALDKKGIAVSVKSACSTDNTPSKAVLAISGDRQRARASWRISFSHLTTFEEVEGFLAAFEEIYFAIVN